MKDFQPQEFSSRDDHPYPSRAGSNPPDHRQLARRLLDQHPSFQGIDRTRAFDNPPGSSCRISLPESIGPYRVTDHIGRGAFGNVYLCREPEPPRKNVAVKVIRAGKDTDEVLARFEAEKVALKMMEHPAIARVIDAGATDDGHPYFAMEYVKGLSLTAFCIKKRLTLEERLRLFINICQGVQHAHTKAVVHRDLKPSNILVTLIDGVPQPKIIDFGLVKSLQQPLVEGTMHSQAGIALGTFEYMSPEQANPSGTDVDTRSDIYALGAILYELLTGELAFAGLRERTYMEIVRVITKDEPLLPSLRLKSVTAESSSGHASTLKTEIGTLTRCLKSDLDWVVMKTLEKDPERRYQTAQELARDIERYLAGEMVEARPPSAIYRLKKTVRRNRGLLSATVLVFLALSGGLTLYLVERGKRLASEVKIEQMIEQFRPSRIDVPAMAVDLSQDVFRLGRENVPDSRIVDLEQALAIDWIEVAKNNVMKSYFAPALAAIEKDFSEQPRVRARLLESLAMAMSKIGLSGAALPLQEKALSIRREILGNDHRDTLLSISNTGMLLKRRGNYKEAQPFYVEALEERRRVLGDDDPDTLDSINNMGILLKLQGNLVEAKALHEEALEGRRRVLGDDDSDTLASINNMGSLLIKLGKLAEAKLFFEEALERKRRVLGNDDPSTLNTISNMGRLLRCQGELDEAMRFLREALATSHRVLGDKHPDTLMVINSAGLVLVKQEKYEEAQLLLEEALETRLQVRGHDHRDTLVSINNMGYLKKCQGKPEEAKPYYEEALERRRRVLGDDDPATLGSMHNLGALYRDLGRLKEAETLAAEAVERGRANEARCLGRFIDGHSHTLAEMGRFAEAEPLAVEAWSILEGKGDATHPLTVDVIDNLVDLYSAWHEADPGAGHDKSAAKWQGKLDALEAARAAETAAAPPPAGDAVPEKGQG